MGMIIIVIILVVSILASVIFLLVNKSSKPKDNPDSTKRDEKEHIESVEIKKNDENNKYANFETVLSEFYGDIKFNENARIPDLFQSMEDFKKTVALFESYFQKSGFQFSCFKPNNLECVFSIEKTAFFYISLFVDWTPISIIGKPIFSPSVIVYEVSYNPYFSEQDIRSFSDEWFYFYFSFMSFRKDYHDKKYIYNHVASIYKDVDLIELNSKWLGVPCSCIVYEINYDSSFAYAIAYTENIENSISIGMNKMKNIYAYEKNKKAKEKKMIIDSGIFDDIYTYDLTCTDKFVELFNLVKKAINNKKIKCEGNNIQEKALSQIKYYVIPSFIKDKDRDYIKSMKEKVLSELNHDYLSKFQAYSFIDGRKKWKNEYRLYQLCKELYGRQVVYQYRPSFLKTDKGQLSYDIYLSKLRIAIEYQGEQHFKSVDFFGGEEAFEDLKRRDSIKKALSRGNDISLIEFTYQDQLTKELIDTRVKKVLEERKMQ